MRFLKLAMPSLLLGGSALTAVGCGHPPATASVIFAWTIIEANAPDPATAPPRMCADLGVKSIRFDAASGGMWEYPCTTNAAETPSFPSGYYNAKAIAFNAQSEPLTVIDFPNIYLYGPTDLGTLRFAIP